MGKYNSQTAIESLISDEITDSIRKWGYQKEIEPQLARHFVSRVKTRYRERRKPVPDLISAVLTAKNRDIREVMQNKNFLERAGLSEDDDRNLAVIMYGIAYHYQEELREDKSF